MWQMILFCGSVCTYSIVIVVGSYIMLIGSLCTMFHVVSGSWCVYESEMAVLVLPECVLHQLVCWFCGVRTVSLEHSVSGGIEGGGGGGWGRGDWQGSGESMKGADL